jgi:hypothetical protein
MRSGAAFFGAGSSLLALASLAWNVLGEGPNLLGWLILAAFILSSAMLLFGSLWLAAGPMRPASFIVIYCGPALAISSFVAVPFLHWHIMIAAPLALLAAALSYGLITTDASRRINSQPPVGEA